MPARKTPPLSDEERAKRIRETAEKHETSNDPADFERAFGKVVKPRVGTDPEPSQREAPDQPAD